MDRVRADLDRVLPEGLRPGEPLALAVSGGPDSMAMLLLAHAALSGRIAAATVDHGLRADAVGEAALVAAACARLGVPHATLRPDRPIAGGNLQARARTVRYALLDRWTSGIGARVLATAHHADDQAETFLMRASRGSGLAGLAAVRARRAHGRLTIVRPLLGWRRAELAAVVAAAGQPVATDPSNDDGRFDRTRIRRLLAAQGDLDPVGLARSAGWLAEAEADLRAVADWFWAERRRPAPPAEVLIEAADLPRAIQRLLALRAIVTVRGDAAPLPAIEAMLDALNAGSAANQAGVLARVERGCWRFRDEPQRRGK